MTILDSMKLDRTEEHSCILFSKYDYLSTDNFPLSCLKLTLSQR